MSNVFINADYLWDIPAINISINYSAGVQILKDTSDVNVVAKRLKKAIELMRPGLANGFITAFRYDIISREFIVTYCHHALKTIKWNERLPLMRLEPLQEGEQPFSLPMITDSMIYDIPWREGYMPTQAHNSNVLSDDTCQPIIKISDNYNHSE